MKAELISIGYIETPYEKLSDCPRNINPEGPLCRLVIKDHYKEALNGLHKGNKILIIYWFEGVDRNLLMQTSKRSGDYKGTFALRSPNRPNPLGVSELTIESAGENFLEVKGLDCLNGTQLIDIKPSMKKRVVCSN